jgi:hypothetical protein
MSDRDFLDEMFQEAELRFGRRPSPDEAAREFALHGADARIQHLKNLKTPESMGLREAAKRHAYESAIRRTHERLRKVGR